MVGLVIGLLATLVVMQVFSIFEAQKRTTTGTADAQTNGNVALFSIKRDVAMAGYGLIPIGQASVPDSPIECTTTNYADSGVTTLDPVTITDGGTAPGASDTITIRYSSSDTGGNFTQIKYIGTAGPNIATVNDNQGCNVNDVALVVNGNTCNLTKVTALSTPPDYTLITLSNTASMGAATGNQLACLGKWQEIVYRVNPNYNPVDPNNSQAYLEQNGKPVVADIVNLQAQYGITATVDSNQIIQWVDATNGPFGNFGPGMAVADRNRIKAIRVAVVARNNLMEKTYVSGPCTSLTADAPAGVCAWAGSSAGTNPISAAPAIDLSNDQDPTDPNLPQRWRRYRYRVFETMIPLRNMIWSKDTL